MEKTQQAYIVSARKYRPQTFDSIIGQEHVTNTLKNAILHNQIAQAYLFFGPRGVGKTTCARVFAKTINCQNLQSNGEACNECSSCKAFLSNTSFNIYELDAASNNSVEDIRQLIDQVRYAPQTGKYKVYIIDEVHMLSTAAFNAFLKTLEEPPPYAKFILATTEKNKVLPTILSRCQVFNFNRIKTQDIAKYLERIAAKENHQYESEALRIIAQKADGGLRDACSIYDQMAALTQGNITIKAVIENLHILDSEYYFQLTEAALNQEYANILLLLDKVLNKGFDPHHLLIGLIDHIRYLLLAKEPQTTAILDLSDSAKSAIIEQSKKCSERFLLNALAILNKADIHFKSSRHQRLHLEIHLLQIANLLKSLEKKNNDDSSPSTQASNELKNASSSAPPDNKNIKVSTEPLLQNVIIQTTASIKKITEEIESIRKKAFEEKEASSTSTSPVQITMSNPSNVPTTSTSLQKETGYSTVVHSHVHQVANSPDNDVSSANQPSVQDTKSSVTSNISNNETLNITEKRYQALLLKNPLLEELKKKLNLEFK